MKAFQFTLEAVRTVRQRQENEALENYARALLLRQQVLDKLEATQVRIQDHFARMRQWLSEGGAASQAAHAQAYHRSLERIRDDCVAVLGQAERRVNAALQAMLAARQQREIVDVYREKQQAVHQRAVLREEQKALDEFAIRRVTTLHPAQTSAIHD